MTLEQTTLLSVIIPVYNAEKYLRQCYMSLNGQTYRNLELIFVNDGSTDGSLEYLKELQSKDARVVIVDQKNKGASAARNAGLSICRGKYVGFCDADDMCEPTMYQNMVEVLKKYDADIACCAIRRVADNGDLLQNLFEAPNAFEMGSAEAMKNWLIGKYIGNSVYTKLTKRELWNGIQFPENEIFEEAKVIPQLISRAEKIVHTGTAEYNYFSRQGSITSKPADERLLAIYRRERYIRDYVLSLYPDLEEEVLAFEIRNNMNAMMGAEMSRKEMKKDVYMEIQNQFNRIFIAGLKNQYITVKDKIKLVELRTKIFYIRKHIFAG